jgi:hypothetical protein
VEQLVKDGRQYQYLELAIDVGDDVLEEIMRRGTKPAFESLINWEFAGTNSHPMTQILPGPAGIGFRKFKKGFYRPTSPRAPADASPSPFIEGYNVVCKQNGVGAPHESVMLHGAQKRHGYFRVYLPEEGSEERRYDNALMIDYALGANSTIDPSSRLRDYLVQIYPDDPDLLLGSTMFSPIGSLYVPVPDYFVLKRANRAAFLHDEMSRLDQRGRHTRPPYHSKAAGPAK